MQTDRFTLRAGKVLFLSLNQFGVYLKRTEQRKKLGNDYFLPRRLNHNREIIQFKPIKFHSSESPLLAKMGLALFNPRICGVMLVILASQE